MAKQKYCNVCHVVLDCHMIQVQRQGLHYISNKPSSASCDGNGGARACATPADAESQGGTLYSGSYSLPEGMAPDVHYKKDIHCADCHTTEKRHG